MTYSSRSTSTSMTAVPPGVALFTQCVWQRWLPTDFCSRPSFRMTKHHYILELHTSPWLLHLRRQGFPDPGSWEREPRRDRTVLYSCSWSRRVINTWIQWCWSTQTVSKRHYRNSSVISLGCIPGGPLTVLITASAIDFVVDETAIQYYVDGE